MTSTDKGVAIVWDAGGFSLTGGTVTMLAAPGTEPNTLGSGISLSPVAIAEDGLTAAYTTTGTDFLQGGDWLVQFELVTSSGQRFTSPPGQIYVFPLV